MVSLSMFSLANHATLARDSMDRHDEWNRLLRPSTNLLSPWSHSHPRRVPYTKSKNVTPQFSLPSRYPAKGSRANKVLGAQQHIYRPKPYILALRTCWLRKICDFTSNRGGVLRRGALNWEFLLLSWIGRQKPDRKTCCDPGQPNGRFHP